MRIDRMLSITILLLSRDRVSAKELAERFEVSVRTIYRDMDAISIAGIPIISYPGNDGGFGIMEGFKLDRQIFTTQDMISILSPLEGVNRAFKSEAITKVVDKIHSLIPSNQKDEVKTSLNRVFIDIHPWGVTEQWKEMFKEIQKAIESQRILKISYTTGEGVLSERDIEPMTLIFKSYTWYLWGYCLNRGDYRMFKLPRITKYQVLNKPFIHRGVSYIEPSQTKKDIVRIKLKCDLSFLQTASEHFDINDIKENNGSLIISQRFPEGEWIKKFILSFGSGMEVLEPEWLRNEIIEELKKTLNKYANPTKAV